MLQIMQKYIDMLTSKILTPLLIRHLVNVYNKVAFQKQTKTFTGIWHKHRVFTASAECSVLLKLNDERVCSVLSVCFTAQRLSKKCMLVVILFLTFLRDQSD